MSIHHSFDIDHAQFFGLPEAILISNLQFWISKNAANGVHQHDGRTWTYNSAKAFSLLFPYFTDRQIRRTIDSLEEQAVIMKGNYNKSACDRTLWLAFVDEDAFFVTKMPAPKSANGAPKRSTAAPKSANGSAGIGESLIEPDVNTDVNLIPAAPTALPTVLEVPPVEQKKPRAKAQPDAETEAAKATRQAVWTAFDDAYQRRYGTTLPRNAMTNSQMASLVRRLGQEAPGVAAFFVCINDAFLIRTQHSLGSLLQNAEGYRTQWATGQAMTATRAQQADKTQSNFDSAQQAKAMLRARREARNAE